MRTVLSTLQRNEKKISTVLLLAALAGAGYGAYQFHHKVMGAFAQMDQAQISDESLRKLKDVAAVGN